MQINDSFAYNAPRIYLLTKINNHKLSLTVNCSDKQFNDLNLSDTCLVLNPQENLTNLFNSFNNFSSIKKQNSDNIRNSCSLSKNVKDLDLYISIKLKN